MNRYLISLLILLTHLLSAYPQAVNPAPGMVKDLSAFTVSFQDSIYRPDTFAPALYRVNSDGSLGEKFTDFRRDETLAEADSLYFTAKTKPSEPGIYALRFPEVPFLRYEEKSGDESRRYLSRKYSNVQEESDPSQDENLPLASDSTPNVDTPKFRVLDLGNSYSTNSSRYLKELVENMRLDTSNVCLYRMVKAGGTFKNWYDIYNDNDSSNYEILHVFGDLRCDSLTVQDTYNGSAGLRSILNDHDWDLILIHQVSSVAAFYDMWHSDSAAGYLPELVGVLKECQPGVPIGTMIIHSYGTNSPSNKQNWSTAQRWCYIASSVQQMMDDYDIDVLIPYGTAIENLRATELNNEADLLQDGSHLSDGLACYTATCCYYEAVFAPWFNRSMAGNTLRPYGFPSVTASNASIAQEAALAACAHPFTIANGASLEIYPATTFYYAYCPEEKIKPIEVTLHRTDASAMTFQSHPGEDVDILCELDDFWEIEEVTLRTLKMQPSANYTARAYVADDSFTKEAIVLEHEGSHVTLPGDLLTGDVYVDISVKYKNDITVSVDEQTGTTTIADYSMTLSNGKLYLQALRPGDEICVYSLAGYPLKTYVTDSDSIIINLDEGIYLIRINSHTARIYNVHL